ncbi:MAG: 1-acyl-sn-glycerol-3-phosphate acyltransferase [Methylococcales bacterium]|nr:1-acyl-sn-glycerol-3-phosphate acyltransferase [Methylococcales bacterium]
MSVIARSISITLRVCIRAIFGIYFGKFDRDVGDRILRLWSKKLLDIIQLKFTVHGNTDTPFKPHEKYIIVSNHQSYYDIPLTFCAFHQSIRMWAKMELFKVPILGKAMRIGEFIPIDRNRNKTNQILEETKKKMESGIIIWIAPEGTCSKDGKLLPFKKGGFLLALQMGAKILPVGITGSRFALPAKTINFTKQQHADIRIGEIIDSADYDLQSIEKLRDDVQNAVSKLVKVTRNK